MSDIRKLREAVEAGTLPEAVFHGSSSIRGHWAYTTGLNSEQRRWVYLAYNGSLDAAKALHDALVPEWHPNLGRNVHHHYWHANVQRVGEDGIILCEGAMDHPTLTRAWLIAILKALEARDDG